MDKNEILSFLKKHHSELRMKFSIEKIGLFGSYAKDTALEESDIDIYAVFKEKKFRNVAGAWNYLENAFGKKVDLFYSHKEMRESLKKSIEEEVIYG